MLKLSRKTCWPLGIASGVLECIFAITCMLGFTFSWLFMLSLLATGCTFLFLAATEEKTGKRQNLLMLCAGLLLVGAMGGALGVVVNVFPWAICALLFLSQSNAGQKTASYLVFVASALQLVSMVIPSAFIAGIIAVGAGLSHAYWCYMLRTLPSETQSGKGMGE